MGPELAVADGALGFWQALEEVWPQTRGQRCWVHKTANVLNKLPKSQQSKAKRALQEIWMAETKKDALLAFDGFIEAWGANNNLFHQGFAKESDDSKVIAAAMAKPGIVLRRPVGSDFANMPICRVPHR
jgi:putative transposase